MGELSFLQKIKMFVGSVAVRIYLWSRGVEYLDDLLVEADKSAAQLLREPVGDTPQACSDYMHDFNKKYKGYIECPYCHKRLVP